MAHSSKRRRVREARELCVRYLRAILPRIKQHPVRMRNIQGTLQVIRQWPDGTGLELVEFAERMAERRG